MKKILTIAGSDSGGGAGIQADLKTITVLGAYGLSVVTALTAQNTMGVTGVVETPVDFIKLQMDTVLEDIGADAVKTGMLSSSEIVEVVAGGIKNHNLKNVVVDPVMVATSGDSLLKDEAVFSLKTKLLPLADLVTPNMAEASILSGREVAAEEDMVEAARAILDLGPRMVLIKGGHLSGLALDILYDGQDFVRFESPRIETQNTHGTGCTLSAALATFLGQGLEPVRAMEKAKRFITRAINSSLDIGQGSGPTNPYAELARIKEASLVITDLREALTRLLTLPLGKLVPEIRTNLGYALPGAENAGDVAAVPGRISQVGDRLVSTIEPAFGASQHVAAVILAAMKNNPEFRSGMAIRYNQRILDACVKTGLKITSFSRADEPKDVKEKEGSSLAYGVDAAIKNFSGMPDLVYDEGEVGKEPVIRVLGKNPMDVIEKLLLISSHLIDSA